MNPRLLSWSIGAVLTLGTAVAAHALPLPSSAPAPSAYQGQWDAAISTPKQDNMFPDFGFPETDVLHYGLDLKWDGSTLNGVTTATVRAASATSSLRFKLHTAMKVTAVTMGGQNLQFGHNNHTLTVQTGQLAANAVNDVVITYGGKPASVRMPGTRGWQNGWQAVSGGVYTLQQPYGAFTWYPSNDHPSDKAFYDATITTTNGQMGIFNGVLTDKQVNGNTTVTKWHLDSLASTYVITIAIDKYKLLEGTLHDGKKSYIWYTDADQRYINQSQAELHKSYQWMTSKAGPYPYSSVGMVVTVGTGAMETQQMILFSRQWLSQSPRTSNIGHELFHHWYGNAVTPDNWYDLWISEGWTMYMDDVYQGKFNAQAAARTCKSSVGQAGQAGKPKSFAETNVYHCPMPAIDKVRNDVGEAFWSKVATPWVAEHMNQTVNRAQFMSWLNSKTGKNYDALFSQWLDSAKKSASTKTGIDQLHPGLPIPPAGH